jgi:hypothetical protein
MRGEHVAKSEPCGFVSCSPDAHLASWQRAERPDEHRGGTLRT